MKKKRLLLFFNHFSPAYKAGGPIRSLYNLVQLLSDQFDFYIITSAYDLSETKPLNGISPNVWLSNPNYKIIYLNKTTANIGNIRTLINEVKPNIIYLNGLFSYTYFMIPLKILVLSGNENCKLIIAARGMLQSGALQAKFFKKLLYLRILKLFLQKLQFTWHATDAQEKRDIINRFKSNAIINVVPNIPIWPLTSFTSLTKKPGSLKLIYLSLIAQKKNLLYALQVLKQLDLPIIYHIYGPIKDEAYWLKCKAFMLSLPKYIQVVYKGDVLPENIQHTFLKYHALFLPTHGENFGHAIYECLSSGRPAIISNATPWNHINNANAGAAHPIIATGMFMQSISNMYSMGQYEWEESAINAYELACNFWQHSNLKNSYLQLFN